MLLSDMQTNFLEEKLKTKFKLPSFRLGQKEIIESVVDGKDVLAVMPTGGGKSLCYQLPSLMKPGLSIVISPLIALMNDQVASLKKLGISVGCIHSGMSDVERREVFKQIKEEPNYILYLSPERIQKPGFAPWLEKQTVNLFAVDEAHCVSQWGHDFRTEYAQLSILRKIKPEVPVIGLTATATPLVKRDIIRQLGLENPDEHVYGFYRPNLYYQVEFCEKEANKEAFVLSALEQTKEGRVLIYCGTRKKTEEWSATLNGLGLSAGFYHAGLSPQERVQVEKNYKNNEVRILAATNAFGMGIDHPDVRLVAHTQIPGNIESYYQEIGRAGRDGKPATCLLAYSKKDKGLQSFFITNSEAPKAIKSLRWSALEAMVQYAEGSECRHGDILTYFKDEKRISKCGHCDSCAPKSSHRISLSVQPKADVKTKVKKQKKKTLAFEPSMTLEQQEKVECIRTWRKEFAKDRDIPAFMVFSDKTLRDLVLKDPETIEGLHGVYGFGQAKVDVLGEKILSLLEELR